MERTWHISDLEFMVLRERLLGRNLPWPFSYVGPMRSHHDVVYEKQRVWAQLQADWDPDLATAVIAAGSPDARVQVRSWDSGDVLHPATRYFLVGNRCGERAVLVHGLCGRSADTYDSYRIVDCDAAGLSAAIVAILPEMPAGPQRRVELMSYHQEETVDHWTGRSTLFDDGSADIDTRSRAWQAAPVTTVGIIDIRQGASKFGPRGIGVRRLFWEDHPGDGRYLIEVNPPVAAVGIDAAGLRTRIDEEIAEILRVAQDETAEGIVRASVFEE